MLPFSQDTSHHQDHPINLHFPLLLGGSGGHPRTGAIFHYFYHTESWQDPRTKERVAEPKTKERCSTPGPKDCKTDLVFGGLQVPKPSKTRSVWSRDPSRHKAVCAMTLLLCSAFHLSILSEVSLPNFL